MMALLQHTHLLINPINRFYHLLFLMVVFFAGISNSIGQTISTESLLEEMVNRENITRSPEPAYVVGQFSSYDRNSTEVNGSTWFANWDRSQWIRIENNQGRREFVMMDIDGPGAIVRFWLTVASYGGNGILRIYIDNNESPVVEGDVFEILSGEALTNYPLSASVSDQIDFFKRGHNLYFPICYGEHCKVTYESDALAEEPGAKTGEALYYNINYRTYKDDTDVQSFTKEDLIEYADVIQSTSDKLLSNDVDLSEGNQNVETYAFSSTLEPDDILTQSIKNSKAIQKLRFKINAENYEQALRSTVLSIEFDGEQTVWCPAGDFFGTGYKLSPFNTYNFSVTENGYMECRWLMPFQNGCVVKIQNFGEQNVTIEDGLIETVNYTWNEKSMHFGAGWFEQYQLHTGDGGRSMNAVNENMFDVNYVTLEGKGVLVGSGVTLFNTVPHWWGEGDEKIYIDNEEFPSHFGTGTEDYYGYAWCRPERFEHPFIAQPDGSGNLTAGYTVNQRYRMLDAIPFNEKLQLDIEMWHWKAAYINHAPVTYWYMQPGGESNRKEEKDHVVNKVVLDLSDYFSKSPNDKGRLEAEYLKASCDQGTVVQQNLSQFNWSNDSQVWWKDGSIGSTLTLPFEINIEGEYEIHLSLTKANDYGIFDVHLNGNEVLSNYDAYNGNGVINEIVSIGVHVLTKGEHTLKISLKGANQLAIKRYMFGLDFLDFDFKTSIDENESKYNADIIVSPNPFIDKIEIANLEQKYNQYQVFDIKGALVKEGDLTGHDYLCIDLIDLDFGIYVLKIDDDYSVKIVKNND